MARSTKAKPKSFVIPYEPYVSSDGRSPQKELAEAIQNGAKKILFLAGVRSGKTYSGVAEILKQIYTYHKTPALYWIVSPTYLMSQVTERIFRKLCQTEAGSLIIKEEKAKRNFYLRPPRGMKEIPCVSLKTGEDANSLRGFSVGAIMLDEGAMMKSAVFDQCQARTLDSKGIILITTTPAGKNWVYNDVALRAEYDPSYVVVRAKTMENPYLEPKEVEDLYARYAAKSDTLARQEMDAEFCDFDGLVFRHFGPDNIIAPFNIPEDAKIVCGVDWGWNDPFVCLFLANIGGAWYLVDEYRKPHTLLDDHAEYLKNHHLWPQIVRIWADPNGQGGANIKEFAARGVRCFRARRPNEANRTVGWPELRARCINRMFAKTVRNPMALGHTRGLSVFSNMMGTIKELQTLCFERMTTESVDPKTNRVSLRVVDKHGDELERNAGEKIQDLDNHSVDALGYALYSEYKVYGDAAPHYFDEGSGGVVEQRKAEEAALTPQEINDAWYEVRSDEVKKKKPLQMRFDTLTNQD